MGEKSDRAAHCFHIREQRIGAAADVLGPFAFGTAVAQVRPAGLLASNLVDGKSVVPAEIHLHEALVNLRGGGEARELGGTSRPYEWTHEHVIECICA